MTIWTRVRAATVLARELAGEKELSVRKLEYAFGDQFSTDELVFAIHDLLVDGTLERSGPGCYRLRG